MVLRHVHIVTEIPQDLKGNVKSHLFKGYTNMMKEKKHEDGKFFLLRLKLSEELEGEPLDLKKRYSVIISETEKNTSLDEKYVHKTQDGVPITFYNFSYDASIEDDFVVMSTEKEDEELTENVGKVLELEENVHVNKSLWNKFMSMAKGFVNAMANLAKPVITALVKLVSFFHKAWVHVKPVVVDWILKAWGICEKFSPVLPVGASTDELVAIAGQLENSKKGFLSFILDRLPALSPTIVRVLLWVGSVLSIVDTIYAVKKTVDAKEAHRKCAQDAAPISTYLKKSANEANMISNVIPSCANKFEYDTMMNQIKNTALAKKSDMALFSSKHLENAERVQKSRSDTSIWTIGRIAIDIIAALSGLLAGNLAAVLIQFFGNLCRYFANLAMYYFETNTVAIAKAVTSAQTVLLNQKFMEFSAPLKFINDPETVKEIKVYATKLGKFHDEIEKATPLSLYGFLECTLSLFKTSLLALFESIKGILVAMKNAAIWVMDRVAEGVDYVCERVKTISMKIWEWLKGFFG